MDAETNNPLMLEGQLMLGRPHSATAAAFLLALAPTILAAQSASPRVPTVQLTDPVRERSQAPRLETFEARVVEVHDGDTISIVRNGGEAERVRLQGVDCPELDQDFGREAKRFTEEKARGQRVEVLPLGHDAHDRLLARVYVEGEDLGRALVRAGLAWHFTQYSHDQHLATDERLAREAKRGLWSQASPIPPWDFRRATDPTEPAAPPAAPTGTDLRGNTRSLLYHRADCANSSCPRCTRRFATEAAARAAGFRPAGCCFSTQRGRR